MKSKKKKVHLTYNKKSFLAPDSLLSMAVVHTKIKPCGDAQIRISDCNNTIKIWNNMNSIDEVEEMILKLETLETYIKEFKKEITSKHNLPEKLPFAQ